MNLRRDAVGFGLAALLLLGGCATRPVSSPLEGKEPREIPPESSQTPYPERSKEKTIALKGDNGDKSKAGPSQHLQSHPAKVQTGLLTPGAQPVRAAPAPPTAAGDKQKINIVFDKADLAEVSKQLFGEYLKLSYVLDPALQGRISLYLDGEYGKDELLALVTKAFAANNVSVVPQKGIYYIQPIQRSSASALPVAGAFVLDPKQDGPGPIIVMYRLRYLDVNKAVNTVKQFLTPGRPMTTDTVSNTIIFAEEAENARTILDVLKALDVNVLQEVGMEIVTLKALLPEEAVQSMENLVGKLDVFKESALKSNVAFLPLPKSGAVLVLAQSPEVMKTAKQWLTALDAQGQAAGEQIYVYFVQNSLARDIGDILNQVFGGEEKTSERRPGERVVSSTRRSGGTTPYGSQSDQQRSQSLFQSRSPTSSALSSSSPTSSSSFLSPSGRDSSGASRMQSLGQGVGGSTSFTTTLSGQVAIITDEINNAIVIRANAADYAMIKKVIEALDILPRAVLIELMIAEISLDKDLEYGLDWFVRNNDISALFGGGNITATIADVASPGLTLLFRNTNAAVLIDMLASKTNVNILSTPTLLAADNQEASITVGGRTPVSTGQGITDGGTTLTSIQYEETGIILTVTPHINAGGLVRIDVDQVIRDEAGTQIVGDQRFPRFTERKVKTTLLAQDKSTVVLGGIIQQRQSEGKSGIPFLQDMPILSPLFSSRNQQQRRTELIIAITPHVIERKESDITREFLEKLRTLRGRIEQKI